MNLTAVLLTGLLAGGVSCAAVQGGLLAGLITRQRRTPDQPIPVRVPADPAAQLSTPRPAGAAPSVSPAARGPWARLTDDLTPVAAFLAGKLISHTVLGALLGALGATIRLSVHAHTALQLVAGALIIAFGLAQLGVPGFRRLVLEPPAPLRRLVLRSARARTAFAPALLGLASVLIPCGVTLSVEALALASGSAASGAATMAVFVVGTSPLFALLGYVARRAATAWGGRLALATGAIVVIMGLVTLNGGLELAGSPLAASRLLASTTSTTDSASGVTPYPTGADGVTVAQGHQMITITATSDGYTPAVKATAGLPTTLIVRSEHAQGCIRAFTIPDRNIQQILPVTGQTRVELGTLAAGSLNYVCGMGMYSGHITTD